MVIVEKKLVSLVCLLLLVPLLFTGCVTVTEPPVAEPKTIFVTRDGTGDYTIIQEAIDAAFDNDTIHVQQGICQSVAQEQKKARLSVDSYSPGKADSYVLCGVHGVCPQVS